jgi:hypothetical protein
MSGAMKEYRVARGKRIILTGRTWDLNRRKQRERRGFVTFVSFCSRASLLRIGVAIHRQLGYQDVPRSALDPW